MWAALAAVAIVAVMITGIVALVTNGTAPGPFTGYDQTARTVARDLKTCRATKVVSRSVAQCVSRSGGHLNIETAATAAEQQHAVATLKAEHSGNCAVVLKGIIFEAVTESIVTETLGAPARFAAAHGGYPLCPVP